MSSEVCNTVSEVSIGLFLYSGSIAALVACIDLPPKQALGMLIDMSQHPDVLKTIDISLKGTLHAVIQRLPTAYLAACQKRLHVVVTRVWDPPSPQPVILNEFSSLHNLNRCRATSSDYLLAEPLIAKPLKLPVA